MKFASMMIELLTGAYNRNDIHVIEAGKPPNTNIGKLFSSFGWGLDLIKDHAERVKLWDNIDKAEGKALDRYGANLGVQRAGTDDIYRLLIKIKMIALLSGGDIDTIINSVASLFEISPEGIRIEESFPAKIFIYVDEDRIPVEYRSAADVISSLTKRIIAAGISSKVFLEMRRGDPGRVYVGTTKYILCRIAVRTQEGGI